jgi:hypothetical protein
MFEYVGIGIIVIYMDCMHANDLRNAVIAVNH